MSLTIALVLKSIMSDKSIAILAFFNLHLHEIFLHCFTFILCVTFVLGESLVDSVYLGFLIYSSTLCILIEAFNSFIFKVIDSYTFIATLLF